VKRLQVTALLIAAIIAAAWAYSIMNSLIQVLLVDVSYFDLGSIFFLGLVAGLFAGLALGIWRRRMQDQG
jgi:H+/Cl- antiporter ClcA